MKRQTRSVDGVNDTRHLAHNFDNSAPTEVPYQLWIWAKRKSGEYPDSTERSGKWLIFVNADEVDEVWAKVKKATEEGKLGDSSKVKAGPQARSRVICVYTYDAEDEADRRRVRAELYALGFAEELGYKSDADTIAGKYAAYGYRQISRYRE